MAVVQRSPFDLCTVRLRPSILLGAFVRPLSLVFIINFICAILIAHLGQTFQQMFPALMMIAAGLFFLFHGAGKLSVDELLERRARR